MDGGQPHVPKPAGSPADYSAHQSQPAPAPPAGTAGSPAPRTSLDPFETKASTSADQSPLGGSPATQGNNAQRIIKRRSPVACRRYVCSSWLILYLVFFLAFFSNPCVPILANLTLDAVACAANACTTAPNRPARAAALPAWAWRNGKIFLVLLFRRALSSPSWLADILTWIPSQRLSFTRCAGYGPRVPPPAHEGRQGPERRQSTTSTPAVGRRCILRLAGEW